MLPFGVKIPQIGVRISGHLFTTSCSSFVLYTQPVEYKTLSEIQIQISTAHNFQYIQRTAFLHGVCISVGSSSGQIILCAIVSPVNSTLFIMAPLKKDKHKHPLPEIQEPAPSSQPASQSTPHRPQTLLQRVSSSVSSIISSIPLPKSTPKQNPPNRPATAPNPRREPTSKRATHSRDFWKNRPYAPLPPFPPAPDLGIPILSTPSMLAHGCPYDPMTYHSFPTFEKHRCDFCGMRPPKIRPSTASESCTECTTGGAFSHLSFAFRRTRNRSSRGSAAEGSSARVESASPVEECPRIVPPHIAAKRIGNPPRRAALPPGIVRGGALRVRENMREPVVGLAVSASVVDSGQGSRRGSHVEEEYLRMRDPVHDAAARPSTSSTPDHSTSNSRISRESNSAEEPLPRVRNPTAPKLHHIHGLPHAKDHPFVHKREVDSHLAALREGSPSPLRNKVERTRRVVNPSRQRHDFAETVYYGRGSSPVPFRRSPDRRPRSHSPSLLKPPSVLVGRVEADRLFVAFDDDEEVRSGRSESFTFDPESGNTYTTRSPAANTSPPLNAPPTLRGGSGDPEPTPTPIPFSFKLKRWILTCRGPCGHDSETDSDAELPPPRIVSPARVARARQRACGIARLPAHISRQTCPPPLGDAPRSSSDPEPVLCVPDVAFVEPEVTAEHAPAASPHLRGGAGSPSTLHDRDTLPPALFWLAGGRGPPVSVRAWRQQRPERRMGGLVGRAVFGVRAGRAYADRFEGSEGSGGGSRSGGSSSGSVARGLEVGGDVVAENDGGVAAAAGEAAAPIEDGHARIQA
ncbi:hypothetical protein P153DRAFT_79673 [Dothidotthia symphoricarpi CBS 119687]|uniref:Uncharacterized protein n=1 Tax=Dothidotthia symphoricarpi CBS 119687 TaxID=1392245 RepID=A0A6A6A3T3_9PLEO|nr:uncharacterized protein P153DRAFT_79673 [Dothidotthia symphoricarpi CBS 119687]KAF2126549.1 hypothetical protein P153DRAFT_79673 [Dothidotthia symphoricarpi CBS 119687]